MQTAIHAAPDGAVMSSEGWAVRFVTPDLLEYQHGRVACLVNVGYSLEHQACEIFASESTSMLAPRLREHLLQAATLLKGRYVVV